MAMTLARSAAMWSLGLVALAFAGCQANYAADLTNATAQPVFVQMIKNTNQPGDTKSMMTFQMRLGPGDRAAIGPMRASDRAGAVTLVVDTLPNPSRAVVLDLMPGTTNLEIVMEGAGTFGPVRVQEKR